MHWVAVARGDMSIATESLSSDVLLLVVDEASADCRRIEVMYLEEDRDYKTRIQTKSHHVKT